MTEITPDSLEALPGEMPRQHISRLRKYIVALMATLAEDDDARLPLQAALDEVDAILADAAHRAAGRLQAALVARMQDMFAESAPADSFEQVVQGLDAPQQDALDRVIPADPAEQAVVRQFAEELLQGTKPAHSQDATPAQAPAPAAKAPPPRMRPNVPRRTENAGEGNRAGGAQAAPAGSQPRGVPGNAPAVRAPGLRGPGARAGGSAPAAPVRQPAGAPTAGRPGPTGSLGSLKRSPGQSERAEGPVDAAPAQPKRAPYQHVPNPENGRWRADGSFETERMVHRPDGKILPKTKPAFVVPPMEPGDEDIPY